MTDAGPVLRNERAVLLIDTFERVHGLEGWLRERFLPRLPEGAVVASRYLPDPMWRTDPGGELLADRRIREAYLG